MRMSHFFIIVINGRNTGPKRKWWKGSSEWCGLVAGAFGNLTVVWAAENGTFDFQLFLIRSRSSSEFIWALTSLPSRRLPARSRFS